MQLDKIDLIWIELCNYPCGTEVARHRHTFYHYIYVDSGCGEITINKTVSTLLPGKFYLIPPHTEHTFFNADAAPLLTCEIKFSPEDVQLAQRIDKFPVCLDMQAYPVKDLLLSIKEEATRQETFHRDVIGVRFALMLAYMERCFQNSQMVPAAQNREKRCSSKIETALQYLYDHHAEEISLEELACLVGFEKNYFLRVFKKETGRTPILLLKEIRIQKAKELLQYSDMNVSQIAVATGFRTVHYFSKVFLDTTGQRPVDYRNEKTVI